MKDIINAMEKIMEIKTILLKLNCIEEMLRGHRKVHFLTIQDVEKMTKLSASTIRRSCRKGELKCSSQTGKLLFLEQNVLDWLDVK